MSWVSSPRVSSPLFVGRARELAVLDAVVRDAVGGRPSVVVVSGDAGIGKTRLLHEAERLARSRGMDVAAGSCIELGDGALPLAPFLDVLRGLHARLPADELAEVIGPGADDLAGLAPFLAAAPSAAAGARPPGPGRQLEALLGLVQRLAARRPLLLAVEDLHWADRSTRDLLLFLARSLRTERVAVLVTVRADDLHRRHPLRPVLAELERLPGTTRLDLEPFTRAELTAQAEAIRGGVVRAELVDELERRTEGNPFFAEELLAADSADIAGHDARRLPRGLQDILLARVLRFDDDHQRVLRALAVAGMRVDHRLLASLGVLPPDETEAVLRDLVEGNVLAVEADSYVFSHALLREAVLDELLPSERIRLHAAVAAALREDCGNDAACAATLAHHLFAARDLPGALASAVEAGLAAERAGAPAEAALHFERALEAWEVVPDAAERSPVPKRELAVRAATAHVLTGGFHAAERLLREALAEVDAATEPRAAGILHERLGWTLSVAAAGRSLDEYEAGLRVVPAEPPSEERASVLAGLARALMLVGRTAESAARSREAIAVAQAVGAGAAESSARNTLGSCLGNMGEPEEGLAELRTALELARAANSAEMIGRAYVNLTCLLVYQMRWDDVLALGEEGRPELLRLGIDRTSGVWLDANVLEALVALGRWDEARALERDMSARKVAPACQIRAFGPDSGDHAPPSPATEVLPADADFAEQWVFAVEELVMSATWEGRLADVRRALDLVLAGVTEDQLRVWSGSLLWRAVWAEADGAEAARGRGDAAAELVCVERARSLAATARRLGDEVTPSGVHAAPLFVAYTQLAEAEARRAAAEPAADAWAACARDVPLAFPAAYARYRQAEALFARDRATAAVALVGASAVAQRLGARPLQDAIALLARRAGVSPSAPAEHRVDGARVVLSPREQEVLGLVAEGLTNGQIAARLFISTKTASVHVSNILAKLGASTRGEAAAVARRLDLLGGREGREGRDGRDGPAGERHTAPA